MQNKCPDCGLVNYPDDKVCRRCGLDLTSEYAPRTSRDARISAARHDARMDALRGGGVIVLIVAGLSIAVSVVSMLFPTLQLGFGIYSLAAGGLLAVLGVLCFLRQRWALIVAVAVYGLDAGLSVFVLPAMGEGIADFTILLRGLIVRAVIFVVLLRAVWHSGGK